MKKQMIMAMGVALLTSIAANAIPAKRGVLTVQQPDGTNIQVQLVGDEFTKCYLTTDNQVLLPNDEGVLCYAGMDKSGRAISSGIKASNVGMRTADETAFLKTVDAARLREAVMTPSVRRMSPRRLPQEGMGKYTSNFPTKGKIRGLVILVEYTDVKFTTPNPSDYFSRLLQERGFSSNGATGSAVDYFIDASMGQFEPQFDVYGPITLAHNMAYYGANSGGEDKAPEQMVVEGVKALDSTVDFSVYDNDGDGVLDNVYVFYAGRGEADGGSANTVWPHSWELSAAGASFTVDGVKVDRYACSNEIISYNDAGTITGPDGIGTFVHEFSHVMGLPDLYHTTQSVYYTPGEYSVMDYGPYNNESRTPPTYSAYERNAMGWIKPELISGPMNCELENLATSNKCYLVQTEKSNEFFLFENRQQTGWDTYIPGHGMLIWHIDFNQTIFDNNVVNNTKAHQYVDIEEANNNPDGSSLTAQAGWPFPGTKYVTEFTDTTKPSMKSWSGKALNLPVTDIDETAGVITFKVAGGVPLIAAPQALDPAMVSDNAFEAQWTPVEGATDYLLSVWSLTEGDTATETANMGSGSSLTLPSGWTSSVNTVYATNGNFGAAKPSLKLGNNGSYLQTKTYSDDVANVTFWYKYNSGGSGSGSTIDVMASADGTKWDVIETLTSLSTAATTVSVDIPEGYDRIRIVYNKSAGNLALDDVVVTYGTVGTRILPGYNGVSTSGKTKMVVDKLVSGVVDYKYTVKATNGKDISAESNAIFVNLNNIVSPHIKGDLNGDGEVDMSDLALLINQITGLAATTTHADLNGDGDVDISDLASMINILVGK